jgi:hypothetical protein
MVRERTPVKRTHAPLRRVVILGVLALAAIGVVRGPGAVWRSLVGRPTAGPDGLVAGGPSVDSAVRVGELENAALDETSGLAASRRRPDLLWAINDSGAPPRLFALGLDGSDRGTVELTGAINVDWEDLAAFELDGTPYLLVADVGDNVARRSRVVLYVVEEPVLAGDRFAAGATASVAWTIELVYEDGPLDCEAVGVDPVAGRVLLVSKRTEPARLYEVPLRPSGQGRVMAMRVAEIANLPRPTAADLEEDPQFGAFRAQVTALDVAADGRELVAVTYKDAYRFARDGAESWAEAVSGTPEILALPRMVQTEAGAYGAGGAVLYVTSEQRPSPLFRLDLAPQGPPAARAPGGGVGERAAVSYNRVQHP